MLRYSIEPNKWLLSNSTIGRSVEIMLLTTHTLCFATLSTSLIVPHIMITVPGSKQHHNYIRSM